MEGEGVVSDRVAQRWFQRFSTGEENTKDLHVLENQNYWIFGIYAEFWKKIRKQRLVGCQKNLVHQTVLYVARLRHLANHAEAVRHELTPQQAKRRVDVCRQLICNPMDDRFMRIVTCHEKWV